MKLFNNEHIFYQHLLTTHDLNPQLKTSYVEIWPSIFLLLCLTVLIIIKVSAFDRVIKLVQSIFSPQALQQLDRSEQSQFKVYNIALNLFFIFNLAFLVYKINLAYKLVLPGSTHFAQFMFFSLLVLVVFAFKYAINKLLTLITSETRLIGDYEVNSILINQASGLFLFPWIVLAQFSKFNPLIFVSGALITLSAGTLIKWYKGLIGSLMEDRVGLLQIFTYFCGLEILPVIVTVKYVIESF
jgi:hypothetical protein